MLFWIFQSFHLVLFISSTSHPSSSKVLLDVIYDMVYIVRCWISLNSLLSTLDFVLQNIPLICDPNRSFWSLIYCFLEWVQIYHEFDNVTLCQGIVWTLENFGLKHSSKFPLLRMCVWPDLYSFILCIHRFLLDQFGSYYIALNCLILCPTNSRNFNVPIFLRSVPSLRDTDIFCVVPPPPF